MKFNLCLKELLSNSLIEGALNQAVLVDSYGRAALNSRGKIEQNYFLNMASGSPGCP